MKYLRILLSCLLIAIGASCSVTAPKPEQGDQEALQEKLLNDGVNLLKSGRFNEAITGPLDKVIKNYETRYLNSEEQIFCARSAEEALSYTQKGIEDKKTVQVLSVTWASAYYLKAYALIDLGRIAEAKVPLQQALKLSPHNAQFLSELGHVYQGEKNWPMSIQTFQAAEKAALEFSPERVKQAELSRAWRGLGYAYVEQKRWDEAEKMYRQCLDADKSDAKAESELQYVLKMKAKPSSNL